MAKTSSRRYSSAAERAKAAAAQAGPGGTGTMFKGLPSGVEFFNVEAGKITLRLLPYVVSDPKHPDGENAPVDELWYKRPFKRYRQIGAENKPYISPLSIGKPDPIYEYYLEAKSDPKIPEKETQKNKPQDCVLYNVQVVDRKKGPGPVMLWWFSYHCFEKQLKKELLDPDNEDCAAFMDLQGGFDLRVRFEKDSFGGNDFVYADNIQFVDREDLDEAILDEVVNLDDILQIKSYDELRNIFLEIDDGGKADDKEDDPPPRRSRGKQEEREEEDPPPRRRRSEEPTPEDEEPPPRRRRQSEPDEDPPPRRRRESAGPERDNPPPPDEKDAPPPRRRREPEPEADPDPEPPPRRGRQQEKKGNDDGCPHGYTFGTDCDSQKECDKCAVWEKCIDAQENAGKK